MVKSQKIKQLLEKSRESTILAVDIYNKPATKFRSYGYIVMMTIAWTALIHAIFEKNKVKYFYRKLDSARYVYVDGERKAWDLSKCCSEYFKGTNSPIKKNLDFFIGIRNKIEHRFLPSLDLEICGECQALLQNYENLIIKEFGEDYSLNESLAIPMQLISTKPEWQVNIQKELQGKNYQIVKKYVDGYRQALDDSVWQSPEYSYRVYLMPQIGNNPRTATCAIEFVQYDPNKPEEMQNYERVVALIKERQIPVINPGRYRAGDVAREIRSKLGIKFSPSHHHAKCWKYYHVRPRGGSREPHRTNTKFCQYDALHKDYVYTKEWIDFLSAELQDETKRNEIFAH